MSKQRTAVFERLRCMILDIVYPQFFGLEKLPFRLRPDAQFLYAGSDYVRARTRLLIGLTDRPRVLLLLGNPGVGKTMLLDDALRVLGADCAVCRIKQPRISSNELAEALVLQLAPSPASVDAIGARDFTPLLVIDDAHLLPPSTAMALTEILTRAPNIKVVLSGKSKVGLEEMAARFLSGEEPLVIRLGPLSLNETRGYIEHRLSIAGGKNREFITADAHALIYQQTAGAPRLINVLCDAALHAACLRASVQLGPADVLLATQDSRWPDAMARDRAGSGAAPDPVLEQLVLSVGQETLSTWTLRPGRSGIGRAMDNDVRLDARFVSRHHCQVTTEDAVSIVEDLESANGISVNGRSVKRHVLEHADQIQIGDHTLTYLRSSIASSPATHILGR
jgi:general secretion pathway protein A